MGRISDMRVILLYQFTLNVNGDGSPLLRGGARGRPQQRRTVQPYQTYIPNYTDLSRPYFIQGM
jgi:hypothetical protein